MTDEKIEPKDVIQLTYEHGVVFMWVRKIELANQVYCGSYTKRDFSIPKNRYRYTGRSTEIKKSLRHDTDCIQECELYDCVELLRKKATKEDWERIKAIYTVL